mmetsp:Transcript_11381/g.23140  ORF Transcript_11381/g.23140 Transcript_11381/m.23140 type:complete len:213 (+) Transcript_11381:851-1489(+)
MRAEAVARQRHAHCARFHDARRPLQPGPTRQQGARPPEVLGHATRRAADLRGVAHCARGAAARRLWHGEHHAVAWALLARRGVGAAACPRRPHPRGALLPRRRPRVARARRRRARAVGRSARAGAVVGGGTRGLGGARRVSRLLRAPRPAARHRPRLLGRGPRGAGRGGGRLRGRGGRQGALRHRGRAQGGGCLRLGAARQPHRRGAPLLSV